MKPPAIEAARLGPYVLMAEDGDSKQLFSCASLEIKLIANSLPVAFAMVSEGYGLLSGSDDESAARLLARVQSYYDTEYKSMVACSIWERDPESMDRRLTASNCASHAKCIFRGYILDAGLVYSTGSPSTHCVNLKIGHSACTLLMKELGDSVLVTANGLSAGHRSMSLYAPAKMLLASTASDRMLPYLTVSNVQAKLDSDGTAEADIATRLNSMVNYILDGIVRSTDRSKALMKDADDRYVDLSPFIKSIWRPKSNGTILNFSRTFNETLISKLIKAISETNIFTAVAGTLAGSGEYLLDMLPRFEDTKDGEPITMHIEPTHTWDTEPALVLEERDIMKLDVSYSASGSLRSPDMLVVTFSRERFSDSMMASTGVVDNFGIYGRTPELAELGRRIFQAKDGLSLKDISDRAFRVRRVKAPDWLARTAYTRRRVQQDDREIEVTDFDNELANQVASAIFMSMYGGGSSAIIQVNPALRFNAYSDVALENCVGKLVEVHLSGDESFRGILGSTSYRYIGGMSSAASLDLTLSSVRPVTGAQEPGMPQNIFEVVNGKSVR